MGFKSSASWGDRYQGDHPGEHGPPVPGKVCHSPTGQMNPSWVDRSFRVSLYSVVVIFLPLLSTVELPARLPLLPLPVLDVLPDPIPQGGPFFWSELRHVLPPLRQIGTVRCNDGMGYRHRKKCKECGHWFHWFHRKGPRALCWPCLRKHPPVRPWIQYRKKFCEACGWTPPTVKVLEVDHIIPRSQGGTHDPENLR